MIVHAMMHECAEAADENGEPNMPRYVSALLRLPDLACADGHLHT